MENVITKFKQIKDGDTIVIPSLEECCFIQTATKPIKYFVGVIHNEKPIWFSMDIIKQKIYGSNNLDRMKQVAGKKLIKRGKSLSYEN